MLVVLLSIPACAGEESSVASDEQVDQRKAQVRAQLEAGQGALALEQIQRVTSVRPEDVEAVLIEIAALELEGRYRTAVEVCERSLGLHPRDVLLLDSKVRLHRRLGEERAAKRALEVLIEVDPENPWRNYEMGELLLHLVELKEIDAAVEHFGKARARLPEAWECAVGEAGALLERGKDGDATRAREILTESLSRHAQEPELYFHRALACEALQDEAAARADYCKVLALAPDHVPALVNLGLLEAAQGEVDPACSHFEHALAVLPAENSKLPRRDLRALLEQRLADLRAASKQ